MRCGVGARGRGQASFGNSTAHRTLREEADDDVVDGRASGRCCGGVPGERDLVGERQVCDFRRERERTGVGVVAIGRASAVAVQIQIEIVDDAPAIVVQAVAYFSRATPTLLVYPKGRLASMSPGTGSPAPC